MIIAVTLFNNDYTQIIQKYFDEGGPFVSTFYNSETEYRKFLKDVKELNKFRYSSSEKEEFKKHLEEMIKQNFINYINSIDENSKWATKRYTAKKSSILF